MIQRRGVRERDCSCHDQPVSVSAGVVVRAGSEIIMEESSMS